MNSMGVWFYTQAIDRDLGWASFRADWESDAGSNALRYTRDGTRHQLSGVLAYKGSTVAGQPRNYGTVVNFAPFATFANPLGNVSYDMAVIGSGLPMRWVLATTGALILYRPRSATWTLTQNEVFPINLHWLAPPGDPDYGLGPAFQR